MLVMSLKEGDYVLIGNNIKVYFEHKLGRDTIDIAIAAPKEKLILRSKLNKQRGSSNAAPNSK